MWGRAKDRGQVRRRRRRAGGWWWTCRWWRPCRWQFCKSSCTSRPKQIIQRSHLVSLHYNHILSGIAAQIAATYHTPGPCPHFWLLLQPPLSERRSFPCCHSHRRPLIKDPLRCSPGTLEVPADKGGFQINHILPVSLMDFLHILSLAVFPPRILTFQSHWEIVTKAIWYRTVGPPKNIQTKWERARHTIFVMFCFCNFPWKGSKIPQTIN